MEDHKEGTNQYKPHNEQHKEVPEQLQKQPSQKSNPWMVVSAALLVVSITLAIFLVNAKTSSTTVSPEDASSKVIKFLGSKVTGSINYTAAADLGNIYKVSVLYKNQEIPVYVTKDGKYFLQGIMPINENDADLLKQDSQPIQEQSKSVPKADKPKVELFVMTHCPYGTQAEKGLLPVLNMLNNKVDAEIKFVHYFMHGEKEEKETYNQLCIREEQKDKFIPYLECFLEDSDTERCLTKVNIDNSKLDNCLEDNAKTYYEKDSTLGENYGVQGSPTLILNSVETNSGRSSSAFLATICSAFNNKPDECTKELSTQNPSPGFGYSNSGSSVTTASCG